MKEKSISRVEKAIDAMGKGFPIVLTDAKSRENEGDLIMPADKITPKWINFMATHARGLICLPMSETHFERLGIPMMASHNRAHFGTAFGVSIGAAAGITTGISAYDRAHTIRVAADPNSTADLLVQPGHVFPLKAVAGGVLVREGHTEGSVDLAKLAGFSEAAVICEIMNDDGTMARTEELVQFSKKHNLVILSIEDVKEYRLHCDCLVTEVARSRLPMEDCMGADIRVFVDFMTKKEHTAIIFDSVISEKAPPLVRLHSACLTGDIFGSLRCDCGEQLQLALQIMKQQGGVLLYLNQEGRGIGLSNKIRSYALQEQGLDTAQANEELGFAADERHYYLAAQILRQLGLDEIQLMTNNPAKLNELTRYGVKVKKRVPLQTKVNDINASYLKTKKEKFGHWLTLE